MRHPGRILCIPFWHGEMTFGSHQPRAKCSSVPHRDTTRQDTSFHSSSALIIKRRRPQGIRELKRGNKKPRPLSPIGLHKTISLAMPPIIGPRWGTHLVFPKKGRAGVFSAGNIITIDIYRALASEGLTAKILAAVSTDRWRG